PVGQVEGGASTDPRGGAQLSVHKEQKEGSPRGDLHSPPRGTLVPGSPAPSLTGPDAHPPAWVQASPSWLAAAVFAPPWAGCPRGARQRFGAHLPATNWLMEGVASEARTHS
ncbi:unnamed protein product, partial [Gulo gulo]